MTSRSLQLARALVRRLEAEQHQPTLQERLDAIFLAGKANIDEITAKAVARLELLAEDYKPVFLGTFKGVDIFGYEMRKLEPYIECGKDYISGRAIVLSQEQAERQWPKEDREIMSAMWEKNFLEVRLGLY